MPDTANPNQAEIDHLKSRLAALDADEKAFLASAAVANPENTKGVVSQKQERINGRRKQLTERIAQLNK